MDFLDFFNIDFLVILGASMGAMLSVLAVGYPLLQRQERHAHIKRVIDYRQQLLRHEKQRVATKKPGAKTVSLRDMLKGYGYGGPRAIRDKLMMAGLRKPRHMAIYMIARIAAPLALGSLTFLVVSLSSQELPLPARAMIIGFTALLGWLLPDLLVKNIIQKREIELTQNFPDALDLMLVCVEGGLGIEQAINTITKEYAKSAPVLTEELGILAAEMAYIGDRTLALKNFAQRIPNTSARSLANAIIQSERYGTPLSQALRTQAYELRDRRMAEAEKKAASLPPKLTVPMIAFFMPSLFIVILGPAALQTMETVSSTG